MEKSLIKKLLSAYQAKKNDFIQQIVGLPVEEQLVVARKYITGEDGVEVDKYKAFMLYAYISNSGNIQALTNYANLLMSDTSKITDSNLIKAIEKEEKNYGVKKRAVECYQIAAEKGNIPAMYNYARMLYDGVGCKKDVDGAVKWFEKAAELGFLAAKHALALLYLEGESLYQDVNKSFTLFKEAADAGHVPSKYRLAVAYHRGLGTDRDFEKAKEYYQQAANGGVYQAMFQMGVIHQNNANDETYTQAIDMFKQCVDLTEDDNPYKANAYTRLAQCYLELHYIQEANSIRNAHYYKSNNKNLEEAKKYLQLAQTTAEKLEPMFRRGISIQLGVYKSILEDNEKNLSKMTYGEFRTKFYNKHPRLFMLTKKNEAVLYEDSIKQFFRKRDESSEEVERVVLSESKNLKSITAKIVKINNKLRIAKPDMEVGFSSSDYLEKVKNDYLVDYSCCVTNINKFIEEILHIIFVDSFYDYNKRNLTNLMNKTTEETLALLNTLNDDQVKNVASVITKIYSYVPDEKVSVAKRKDQIVKYINTLKNNTNKKRNEDLASRINLAKVAGVLSEEELKMLDNIEQIDLLNTDIQQLKKDDFFELGQFFDLTFISHEVDAAGEDIKTKNKLKEEIIDYVQAIGAPIRKNFLVIKFNELVSKIECFRILVRNVSSHKSVLAQAMCEKGLNLCIAQENSIFNLLDQIFGNFLETKYANNIARQHYASQLTESELNELIDDFAK